MPMQPCLRCGELILAEAERCSYCGARDPHADRKPLVRFPVLLLIALVTALAVVVVALW